MLLPFLLLFASTGSINPTQAVKGDTTSVVGYWTLAHDEDGTPSDTMEIRNDGTYISHGINCEYRVSIPYHMYKGDAYATIEIPGKGPISIVFRPNLKGQLVFTSPRTRNNAYYERVDTDPCPATK